MRIAIIGGTGKEGRGLGVRWARSGHDVALGSRDSARAIETAKELSGSAGVSLSGGANAAIVAGADIAVLAVPFDAHEATLRSLTTELRGMVLMDITVPLKPPKVRTVQLPEGNAAALRAQAILGAETHVVAALHHISSAHLAEPGHVIDSDVLFCTDDARARELAGKLIVDLGMRPVDAGPLANAVALESMTPVLLHINRLYKIEGSGLRITGLPPRE